MLASDTITTYSRAHAPGAHPGRRWVPLAVPVALLAAVYLYLWLWLDPWARYSSSAPVFFGSGAFFRSFLSRPGGMLEYGCAYLAQWDYYPALGALAAASVLALLSTFTGLVLQNTGNRLGLAWVLPAALVLGLYNQYLPGVLELAAGMTLAAASVCAWLRISARAAFWQLVQFSGFAVVLFYLAGPSSSLLFIILGGLMQWLNRARLQPALQCWTLILPWLTGVVWRGDALLPALAHWNGSWLMPSAGVAVYSFLPLVCAGVLFWRRWHPLKAGVPGRDRFLSWSLVAQTGLATLAASALVLSVQPNRRALLRIQAEAEQANWGGVLEAAAGLREYPVAERLQVQRALFHQGRLTSDLFSFPQESGSDLLASLSDGLAVCVPLCDTLLELGHINLAERYAHEFLEVRGERPELLWRLAWINLVKDRPQAARIFLKQLRKVPFHRSRADRWLASIDRDATMTNEGDVMEARLRRVSVDQVERAFPTEDLLRALLRPDRPNPMAAEYLLAHLLLRRQLDQIAQQVLPQKEAVSQGVPRHVEEAILALQQDKGGLNLQEWRIRPETVARFDAFRRAVTLQAQMQSPASSALARDFGNTYWFYDLFGRSAPASQERL